MPGPPGFMQRVVTMNEDDRRGQKPWMKAASYFGGVKFDPWDETGAQMEDAFDRLGRLEVQYGIADQRGRGGNKAEAKRKERLGKQIGRTEARIARLGKKNRMHRPFFESDAGGQTLEEKLDSFDKKLDSGLDKKLSDFDKKVGG